MPTPGTIAIIILVVLILAVIVSCIQIVQQSKAYVVERLGALHRLGTVGNRLHELGYLLVLLGELVDEGGERWRIGSARPLVTVYLLCISVCITLCISPFHHPNAKQARINRLSAPSYRRKRARFRTMRRPAGRRYRTSSPLAT